MKKFQEEIWYMSRLAVQGSPNIWRHYTQERVCDYHSPVYVCRRLDRPSLAMAVRGNSRGVLYRNRSGLYNSYESFRMNRTIQIKGLSAITGVTLFLLWFCLPNNSRSTTCGGLLIATRTQTMLAF